MPGENGSLHLTGTAIRVKKIVFVSVQVYAVGLYTDKKAAKATLPSKVSPTLFSTLLSDDTALPLTIRLEMVRTVGGDTMSAALKEAIEPRLAAIYKDAAKTNADMEKFTKQFDMPSLATGTVLTFAKTSKGKLITEVAGVSKGEIASPALCKAFLRYLSPSLPLSLSHSLPLSFTLTLTLTLSLSLNTHTSHTSHTHVTHTHHTLSLPLPLPSSHPPSLLHASLIPPTLILALPHPLSLSPALPRSRF